MTLLTEALAEFTEVQGHPGKFEGEDFLTYYCHVLTGNGAEGDVLSVQEDGCGDYVAVFVFDEAERTELASVGHALADNTSAVVFTENDQGFCSSWEVTAAQEATLRARFEAEDTEAEDTEDTED